MTTSILLIVLIMVLDLSLRVRYTPQRIFTPYLFVCWALIFVSINISIRCFYLTKIMMGDPTLEVLNGATKETFWWLALTFMIGFFLNKASMRDLQLRIGNNDNSPV